MSAASDRKKGKLRSFVNRWSPVKSEAAFRRYKQAAQQCASDRSRCESAKSQLEDNLTDLQRKFVAMGNDLSQCNKVRENQQRELANSAQKLQNSQKVAIATKHLLNWKHTTQKNKQQREMANSAQKLRKQLENTKVAHALADIKLANKQRDLNAANKNLQNSAKKVIAAKYVQNWKNQVRNKQLGKQLENTKVAYALADIKLANKQRDLNAANKKLQNSANNKLIAAKYAQNSVQQNRRTTAANSTGQRLPSANNSGAYVFEDGEWVRLEKNPIRPYKPRTPKTPKVAQAPGVRQITGYDNRALALTPPRPRYVNVDQAALNKFDQARKANDEFFKNFNKHRQVVDYIPRGLKDVDKDPYDALQNGARDRVVAPPGASLIDLSGGKSKRKATKKKKTTKKAKKTASRR